MSEKNSKFEEILNHYSELFRYAYWLTGNKEVAQDLVQETYLRAWRYYDTLKNEKATKGWLISILRRENARRFEKKVLTQSQMSIEILKDENASSQLDTRPEAFALNQALGELSEEYREPLLLQVIWGFSCKEIAQQLEISPEAVMTRLFRARQSLKNHLLGGGFDSSIEEIPE